MNGDSVHVCVVHEPHDLVGKQFSVVLGVQVRFDRLRGVKLQTFADALSQHVQGRVGFHDLGHRLRDELLRPQEPVAVA